MTDREFQAEAILECLRRAGVVVVEFGVTFILVWPGDVVLEELCYSACVFRDELTGMIGSGLPRER